MYFCKNCGEPYMTDEAVMCVKCGVAKGQGNNYCHNCGKPLAPDAAVCLNCGVANKQAPAPDAKSKLVAGLLAIFLGTFGVHNFYLGYTGKAVTQLVLSIVGILLCCVVVGVFIVMGVGIWGLVEGIMILTGSCNSSCTAAGEQRNQCTGYCQPGTGYPFHRTWMLHRMDRRTVWNRWYHLRSICQQAGQDRPGKGWTDLFYHWYCTGNYHYNLSCCIFCSIYE